MYNLLPDFNKFLYICWYCSYLTMHTLASYSETETNEVYMRKDDTLYKHAQSDPNMVAYV
jgi:hypothetical protein